MKPVPFKFQNFVYKKTHQNMMNCRHGEAMGPEVKLFHVGKCLLWND